MFANAGCLPPLEPRGRFCTLAPVVRKPASCAHRRGLRIGPRPNPAERRLGLAAARSVTTEAWACDDASRNQCERHDVPRSCFVGCNLNR